nr:hypothetical protein [Tanacetum cinerariifolium]
MGNVKKSVAERTRHKRQHDRRMKERQMQSKESKVVDANIRPVNAQVLSAEVHLTAPHNVLANKQQHINQFEPSYDTYLLEKGDINTTPDLTNMSHRGGEIDQDAEQDQVKITPHYLPKVREYVLVKPHHVIAPGSSKNRQEESWKLTGRIFKTAGLRWIPTGKMFIDCTTKVDSEPLYGLNYDITNPNECEQTLNSMQTLLFIDKWRLLTTLQAPLLKEKKGPGPQLLTPGTISSGLVPQPPSLTPNVPPTKNDWDMLFCLMFDEYFNPSPSVVQPVLVAAVYEPVVSTGTPSSTRINQDTPSIKPSSEESSSQIVILTNMHSANQLQEMDQGSSA